jgi:hypothetical protein
LYSLVLEEIRHDEFCSRIAYHRDEADGVRDRIIAGLLIPSIAALLEASYRGVSMSIDEHSEWVAQFLTPPPSFAELGSVAAAAGRWLVDRYCPNLKDAAKILAGNLEGRLGNLARVIENDLYPPLQESWTSSSLRRNSWLTSTMKRPRVPYAR